MWFEHVDMPMLSRIGFIWRLLRQLGLTIIAGGISLVMGMCGYHYLEDISWLDAFVNASMLLGGMGPIGELHTVAGKLFAGFYALYCGVFMVVCGGLLLVPVFHRVLHHFHSDAEDV